METASTIPFDRAKYVSLRSFKRDGSPVDTPVWFAVLEGRVVIFTLEDSFKVKRIRRDSRVALARCDFGGRLHGPWFSGTCRLVPKDQEPDRVRRAYAALNAKYGLTMRVGTLLSTLSGRVKRRVILEVTLREGPTATAMS